MKNPIRIRFALMLICLLVSSVSASAQRGKPSASAPIRCDSITRENETLREIVAVQQRQLDGRATEIGLLKRRAVLADTTIGDLERRANARLNTLMLINTQLTTENAGLVTDNAVLAAERDRLKGRTWFGKLFRKARNVLAYAGAGSVAFVLIRVL